MNNTEIVKNAYECFGSGNIQGLLELYSDDVSWITPKIDNAVYSGARQQAIDQAARRQSMISDQTSRGIESNYNSIIDNFDLARRRCSM